MKLLFPLIALLLLGTTTNAQESDHKKVKYHVSYVDQNGQAKCSNSASKDQAETCAARMRAKRDLRHLTVAEGYCERKEEGAIRKPEKPVNVKPNATILNSPGTKPGGSRATTVKPGKERPQVNQTIQTKPSTKSMESKPTTVEPRKDRSDSAGTLQTKPRTKPMKRDNTAVGVMVDSTRKEVPGPAPEPTGKSKAKKNK